MEKINIQGVPETMLQTLYARAAYSEQKGHLFYDAKAIELVSRIDYNFTHAASDAMMSNGVIARTVLLDRMVCDFIKMHPDGTVINITCGLDTRFYRVDNGKIRWYNLDLPETAALRERLLQESGRISVIAKSAMDGTWADEIEPPKDKTLVLIEGLVMYLTEPDVRQILSIIDRRFTEAEIIMEIMNPWVVKHMKERSIESTGAKFTWGLKSGRALKPIAPNLTWIKDVSLAEGMKLIYPAYRLFGWIPAVKSISNKLVLLKK